MCIPHGKDRTPLEAEKPIVDPGLEEKATDLFEGKMEITQAPKDAYDAQLQRSRAAKVLSAEKVLEKATNDPKVKKTAIKKARKGKGKGRGKSDGADATASGERGEECTSGSPPEGTHVANDAANGAVDPCYAAPPAADQVPTGWAEKETHSGNTCEKKNK